MRLKILLTDADIQRPRLHDVLKTSPSGGLTDPKNDFAGSIGGKKVGPGELYLLPAGKSGHAGMDKNVYVLLIVDGRCNMQSLLQRRLFFL